MRLLESHQRILGKIAHAYCRHSGERDDLIAEMTAALWSAFPRYDARYPFSTWTYRIALNVAISAYRMRWRRVETDSTTDPAALAAAQQPDGDERVEHLKAFIASLPELDRALMLLYLDAYSYAEIAATLGLTQTNVATKLNRLKARARAALTDAPAEGEAHGTR
jgi:RNA polymerase sigma-70 factor, ECF subfamily